MPDLRRLLPWLLLLVVVLVEPRHARAAVGTVDQQSEMRAQGSETGLCWLDSGRVRQQVKAGVTGTLAGVALTLNSRTSAPVTFTLSVKRGPAPIDGPALFSTTFTPSDQVAAYTTFIDMTAANIQLTTDELFTLELGASSPNTHVPCGWWASKGYSEPLYMIFNGVWSPRDPGVFTTYMLPPATIGVSLDASPSLSVVGEPVTLKARVTGGTTNDTVQFLAGGVEIGSALISAGEATLVTSTLTAGAHTLTARYVPTGTTSSAVVHGVNKVPTTLSLTTSKTPSLVGQPVMLTATVEPATVAGSVTFKEGASTLGSATIDPMGVASLTVNLPRGTHILRAEFAGDAMYVPSTSATLVQTVNKGSTTTAVVTSESPSLVGQPVTFTATVQVAPPAAGTPTGTVTFKEGASTLGSGALDGAGMASFVATTLSLGPHTITAEYAGDGNFDASVSAEAVTQLVELDGTLVDLQASTTPSTYGQGVTFTATLTASDGATTPSGSVTFTDVSATPPTTLGTVPLVGGGAAVTTDALAVGKHIIEVTYGGDTIHDAASASRVHVVDRAASAVALTRSAATTVFGQAVTLTATVTSAKGPLSGSVTFARGGFVLGTAPVEAGAATLSTASLPAGTNDVEAAYSGDANHEPSASTATHQVSRASTSTAVISSSNPSAPGSAVIFTAQVSAVGPGAGAPGGTVTFSLAGAALGVSPLDSEGRVTFTTAVLTSGTHAIQAMYSGDERFAPSTSDTLQQAVGAEPPATAAGSESDGCHTTGRPPASAASAWALVGLAGILARRRRR